MFSFSNLRYNIIALRYLISEEKKYDSGTRFFTKIKLLLKGFTSEKKELYDFEKNNIDQYLTDFQRRKTQKINGKYSILIDDKEIFEIILRDQNVVPKTFGKVENGIVSLSNEKSDVPSLISLVKHNNSIIIKKKIGGGGKGIYRIEYANDVITINNKITSEQEFNVFLANLDDSLISEHLKQADYSNEIYPGTINTIRMLILKDPNTEKSFIASAVHKFGSKKTEPADNVWRGGLTSLVNIDTGIIQRPALHQENNKAIEWVETHPDTNIRIEGTQIPYWNEITTSVLNLTDNLENIQYIGWDVVVTNDGFKIIEGNNFSDVNIIQIHQPLLNNKRVREFYEYHKIL